mmetsp:Transcript_14036/g.29368  ORF Transcript_14036/g.29368 Transcript_14036/m.29368 type:complete len:111 (-) Transcript_14036:633-965(-)
MWDAGTVGPQPAQRSSRPCAARPGGWVTGSGGVFGHPSAAAQAKSLLEGRARTGTSEHRRFLGQSGYPAAHESLLNLCHRCSRAAAAGHLLRNPILCGRRLRRDILTDER